MSIPLTTKSRPQLTPFPVGRSSRDYVYSAIALHPSISLPWLLASCARSMSEHLSLLSPGLGAYGVRGRGMSFATILTSHRVNHQLPSTSWTARK